MDELIKIAIVAVSAPVWWPFFKAIREELRDLFAPDGGMLGELPPPRVQRELEEELAQRPPKLVHEWIANRRPESVEGAAARGPAPGGRTQPTRVAVRGGAQRSARR